MTTRSSLLACCTASLLLLASPWALAYDKARPPQAAASGAAVAQKPAAAAKLVDINSASRAELKTLPGIGDAEADKIIAARPYPSKAKLVADKVLPDDKYAALRGRIVAGQTARPSSAGAGPGKASAKP